MAGKQNEFLLCGRKFHVIQVLMTCTILFVCIVLRIHPSIIRRIRRSSEPDHAMIAPLHAVKGPAAARSFPRCPLRHRRCDSDVGSPYSCMSAAGRTSSPMDMHWALAYNEVFRALANMVTSLLHSSHDAAPLRSSSGVCGHRPGRCALLFLNVVGPSAPLRRVCAAIQQLMDWNPP